MIVRRARLRDVRSYAAAELEPGAGLTIVHGANGSGKTNLLEALFFGLTGRSCRTSNERELVRLGAAAARVEVELLAQDGRRHDVTVGFRPGEPKRLTADGASVERLTDVQARPLVSVFLPDRLELVKGPPALRRAHVDQVVAATWPARVTTRRAYGAALAQRNALIGRIRGRPVVARASPGPPGTLDPRAGRRRTLTRGTAAAVGRAAVGDPVRGDVPLEFGLEGQPGRCGYRPNVPPSRRRRGPRGGARPSARTRGPRSVATPSTVRTATTSCSPATAASCGPSARRASSGSPSSRCCSPSATSSPRRATPCPSCCSTTS